MKQRKVFLGRDLTLRRMDKTPLVDIGILVTLVYLRKSRQIEVLIVQSDNAIVIDRLPLSFVDNTIGKSVKAPLSNVVPSQLRNSLRLFCSAVDVRFKQFVFLLLLEESEVSFTFNLFLETVKFRHVCLL